MLASRTVVKRKSVGKNAHTTGRLCTLNTMAYHSTEGGAFVEREGRGAQQGSFG